VGDCSRAAPGLLVEIWLAVPTAEGWRALMLLRSERRGGFWQGVSGRVEPDDGTFRAAANRELQEELGLPDGIELFDLGSTYTFQSEFSERWFSKRCFGARLPRVTPDELTLSHEHVEARVVTFDAARELVRWPEYVHELHALENRVRGA
jgi:8-oxo-dGTP pyrophosphatase MutT (NUDIX family)